MRLYPQIIKIYIYHFILINPYLCIVIKDLSIYNII